MIENPGSGAGDEGKDDNSVFGFTPFEDNIIVIDFAILLPILSALILFGAIIIKLVKNNRGREEKWI